MNCGKISYPTKKEAKRSAKFLSRTAYGGFTAQFGIYHCKGCNQWHTYTSNATKLKHNSEHARGGRGRRRSGARA